MGISELDEIDLSTTANDGSTGAGSASESNGFSQSSVRASNRGIIKVTEHFIHIKCHLILTATNGKTLDSKWN